MIVRRISEICIKLIHNIKYSMQVFMKNGHLFEALLQFEEDGDQMIKAVQLDSTAECVVEVPLADVELFRTSSGAEIVLPS